MKKILIIQTAFIGDVILATSLIEEVRSQFPKAKIDFLLRQGNESIIETNPNINKVLIWNKNKNKLKSLFHIIRLVRQNKYDTVLNIQRFFNSGLITILSGAQTKIGFDKNPLSLFFTYKVKHQIPHIHNQYNNLHEVQRNQLLLEPLLNSFQLKAASQLPLKIEFSKADEIKIQELELPQDYIVIAPTSVWFTKQFSLGQWEEFVKIASINYPIYIIGAPDDESKVQSLLRVSKNIHNLCGKLSLRQSALLMQKAKRVFVNDSAPLHLASAVNAKTTAIFCSTIPAYGYGPISENSLIIEHEGNLRCRPCGLHGKKQCPEGHFKCSKLIRIEQLVDSIDRSKSQI